MTTPPFSERMGFKKPKEIQLRGLDAALRNSLWNICRSYWFEELYAESLRDDHLLYQMAELLQRDFYKQPIDDLPSEASKFVRSQLEFFQEGIWHDVLELVEFLGDAFRADTPAQQKFRQDINNALELEKSGFRFVGGKLALLTNEIEMQEVEQALGGGDRFASVAVHVKRALELYSQKPQPDYRNSIKESISAVESAAKIITNLPGATLGDAIKEIDKRHSLHSAFKEGISKLYGYTSDQGGIRHSLTEAGNIDESNARFMLVSCSAFANYLVSRYDQHSA
jgi:AbiJ N-terminal domain 4